MAKKNFFSVMSKHLNREISTNNLVTFKRWDGVNDKTFQYYGSSLKNPLLGGGREVGGESPKKGGLGEFADLTGDFAKEEVMFLRWIGVETLMCTMSWRSLLIDRNIQSK